MHIDFAAFSRFREKMAAAGEPPLAIKSFERSYELLCRRAEFLISEKDIQPVSAADMTDIDSLPPAPVQTLALNQVAVIKLNGGLGTSMGLEFPKAAIEAREGLSFLDITAQQAIHRRREWGIPVPLILMTSFNTHAATPALLEPYRRDLASAVPAVFSQHRFPKVLADSLTPAVWPLNPNLEWNPPGHGDLYAALVTSGMLDALLKQGFRYAFVSNIDNLGARLDLRILDFFANSECPFLMEVTRRAASDSKGGHLAKRADGALVLREAAQCPKGDADSFQDINRHRYFNTNSLWINLQALQALIARHEGLLPLPLIKNEKNLDPRNPRSPRVYQLETAMGAAISLFDRPRILLVSRDRFIPVKKCGDLLALWSDRYALSASWEILASPECRERSLMVELDSRTFGHIDQLKARFPYGAPSLIACESLTVTGDVIFGKNIRLKGRVVIVNSSATPLVIPDHTVIEDGEYGR